MAKQKLGGRPPYKPTNKDRRFVLAMVLAGIEQLYIARAIGITKPTLRKHFRAELDSGQLLANAEVVQSLFDAATGKNGPVSVPAAIYWTKANMGWTDQPDVQKPGKKEREERQAKETANTGNFQRRPRPPLKAVD